MTETEISNLIKCNELSVIQILHRYYEKLQADVPFYCGVMVSIAGHVASPLFSVYGASKRGIRCIIENLNSELAATGSANRILDISPGSLKGTRFNEGPNNLSTLQDTAHEMTGQMFLVGVHENGSWKGKETFISLEERMQVVASCRYVDKVIFSYPEDCDVWKDYHYHKLFVGSDYKGTERFRRYEEYFRDKNVEIVYFPYTKGVSSTMLRQKLSNG